MASVSRIELEPARIALLVVDMQNDFCKQDGFFARAGHDVSTCQQAVGRTRLLLEQVRPLGIPVFWSRSIEPEPPAYKLPPLRFRAPRESGEFAEGVGGTNCFVPGAWGSEIVDDLEVGEHDVVIDKPRYNAFHGTSLETELHERGIESIVVAGVLTNCCVESTSRDAFMRDFGVLVLSDCVGTFRDEWELHEASLRNLALFFAVVATSTELVDALRAPAPPASVLS